jgi:transcriptional regulator with XRE-family HTH domain
MSGTHPPRRPTISDIAREAGVSKVSVSYALNGQPGVSEATRKRILAIADQLGFLLLDVIDGKPAEAVQTETARLAPRASTAPPATRARL